MFLLTLGRAQGGFYNCSQCVFVPSTPPSPSPTPNPTPNPTPVPMPTPTPTSTFTTLLWSGGDQSTALGGSPPFQVSKANLVALASALPSASSSFFPSVWNYITAHPPSSTDPRKYLLSIGGSVASASGWTSMMNSPMSDWVSGFSSLYTNNNVYGIDWDLENVPTINISGLVAFCSTLGTQLKAKFPDYHTGFTIFASYLSTSTTNYQVAHAIARVSPKPDYVGVMLYSNTMYNAGGTSGSGGVAWSSYLYYGSKNSSCLYNGGAFPSSAITVYDMFHSSGIPILAGVVMTGQYACSNECFQALDTLRSQGVIQGIAIWGYGLYAAGLQCSSSEAYSCTMMSVLDQVVAHFNTGSALPSNSVINTGLPSAVLPWVGYDGFGCFSA